MSREKKVPELRFQGFTDAWTQRKLGDFGSVAMNRRIFKEETAENGEIPFYKIGTFGSRPDAFISRELFEKYKSKYPYPETGDLRQVRLRGTRVSRSGVSNAELFQRL